MMQTASLAGLGLVTLLYTFYRSLLPKPIPGIPYNGESANRILGDIPDMTAAEKTGARRMLWWADLVKKHNSPVVQFFFGLGTKPGVVVADYREARDIILRRSKELVRGYMNRDPWLGLIPGHFIAMEDDHPKFKGAKSLGKDLMGSGFLHGVSGPASYDMVHNLIELWQFKAKNAGGLPFDAEEDVSHMTFDIMQAAAFGISPSESSTVRHLSQLQGTGLSNTARSKLAKFPKHQPLELLECIHTIEEAAGGVIGKPNAGLYHFINNNFNSKMRKAARVKEATLRFYIERSIRRLSHSGAEFKPQSAADYMVSREAQAATKAGVEPSFYSQELKDGLIGYIIGGHDSTSSTLCFMAKRLGRHQEAQGKLRESLYAAYPNVYREHRQPTADDILKMQIPYLDAFIQEILRIDPPSPLTARKAACDMDILGHVVPRGTLLFFPVCGPTFIEKGWEVPEKTRSHSSITHGGGFSDWADSAFPPDEFCPERWLRTEGEGGDVYDSGMGPFMTFGSGKRGCWGQRLAYLELKLITTLLVWNFQFEPLPVELDEWEVHDEEIFARARNTLVQIKSLWDPEVLGIE